MALLITIPTPMPFPPLMRPLALRLLVLPLPLSLPRPLPLRFLLDELLRLFLLRLLLPFPLPFPPPIFPLEFPIDLEGGRGMQFMKGLGSISGSRKLRLKLLDPSLPPPFPLDRRSLDPCKISPCLGRALCLNILDSLKALPLLSGS